MSSLAATNLDVYIFIYMQKAKKEGGGGRRRPLCMGLSARLFRTLQNEVPLTCGSSQEDEQRRARFARTRRLYSGVAARKAQGI